MALGNTTTTAEKDIASYGYEISTMLRSLCTSYCLEFRPQEMKGTAVVPFAAQG